MLMQPRLIKAFAGFVLLAGLSACDGGQATELHLQGSTMGTYYSIKVIDSPLPQAKLQPKIDAALAQVNAQMSTYLPDSELSRFNQHHSIQPFEVSADTALVMQEALRLGEATGGALDVTVGPLVNLWGFGPQPKPDALPSAEEIAQAKAKTGFQYLEVSGTQVRKHLPELYVDLSAIAKGFGVDKVAAVLDSLQITNYLVEIGGEVVLKGHNAKDQGWQIGIEQPDPKLGVVQQVIRVGDNAIATSGDYRNYFELEGQRVAHTTDPTTGKPITHRLVSVTVVDPSCMRADGLATALMVLGPERALAYAEANQLAIYTLTNTDQGLHAAHSSAFKPYLPKDSVL